MSAYQSYAGAYEFDGESFDWRCYATARVHAVRRREHAPFPSAPPGRKWLWRSSLRQEPVVGWLVDDGADEFSHMLLQVQRHRAPDARFAAAV